MSVLSTSMTEIPLKNPQEVKFLAAMVNQPPTPNTHTRTPPKVPLDLKYYIHFF